MNVEKENFSFSPGNIERIRSLNAKLKKEEERIRPFAISLNVALRKLVHEKQIDDFNITQKLSVFSNNTLCNRRHNVEDGDPFRIEHALPLFDEDTEDYFYSDNWNEFRDEHPLVNEVFCYSMHCLLFHGSLTLQDIADIDYVWIDLKLDYQFCFEM